MVANIYLFKFNNRNTRTGCEIFSKLKKDTTTASKAVKDVVLVYLEHISQAGLVFLLLTLENDIQKRIKYDFKILAKYDFRESGFIKMEPQYCTSYDVGRYLLKQKHRMERPICFMKVADGFGQLAVLEAFFFFLLYNGRKTEGGGVVWDIFFWTNPLNF